MFGTNFNAGDRDTVLVLGRAVWELAMRSNTKTALDAWHEEQALRETLEGGATAV